MSLFSKLFGNKGDGREEQTASETRNADEPRSIDESHNSDEPNIAGEPRSADQARDVEEVQSSAGADQAAPIPITPVAEPTPESERHEAEHTLASQIHAASDILAAAAPGDTPAAAETAPARSNAEAVTPAGEDTGPPAPARAEVLAFPGKPRPTGPAAEPSPAAEAAGQASTPRKPVSIASTQREARPQPAAPQTVEQMRQDPNLVRVFDQYGQEIFVSRQQWREEILPNNIRASWNNPDELYAVMLNAINDGLFAEIEPAAQHLREIDPMGPRAACLLAIVQLQLGRTAEAEATLEASLSKDGEDSAVLTNLSRVLAARGERERAETLLWRALELDPNLENAVAWYVALEQERDGEAGRERALDRLLALPGSWRARLWRGKAALDAKNLPAALEQYRAGLATFPETVSPEFLYPMSGDLGLAGHLRELLDLTAPRFVPEVHGLPVGNNLIKAHFDLGELDQAGAIVARLFSMRRPDWRESLGFWEQTINRAQRAQAQGAQGQPQQGPLEIGMLEMNGPVWRRTGGPLEPVFGLHKPTSAPVVTILGGSADLPPLQGEVAMQLADAVGRLTRAMPLFLAEQLEFHTAAQARTLLPRVPEGGFVLRGSEWGDAEAIELAREAELPPDFIVRAHIDTRAQTWVATARVARGSDGADLGSVRAEFPAGQPEYGLPALASSLERLLERQGVGSGSAPAAYQLPDTGALSNYLLRLEQLLILRSIAPAQPQDRLSSGEREVMEGVLGLALQQPANPTVRALMAATTMTMWRLRPEIAEEFEDRLELLGREQPLGEPLDGILLNMVTDEL